MRHCCWLTSQIIITTPFQFVNDALSVPSAEASTVSAILVESFDENVTTDGSTFSLARDVGDTNSAFIRMMTGTRKTSAGPIGVTTDTAPDVGTVGLVLTDTNEVTVRRASATEVKVMGEVWRYQGLPGGEHEFIVRDRVEIALAGLSNSTAISGITNVDDVIPFVTGYTVNDSSVASWEEATIAAHMDDSGNLVVSRNNSGTAATVYVDIVEFTGSAWTVCHGYSNAHDTAEQTIALNTDSDGQGGSSCDVTDWGTASIIEATMEGDSSAVDVENGLSDTLGLVRPGGNTTSVVFDIQGQASARNDGEAWIHVLQNDDMVVSRASNTNLGEGNNTAGTAAWPAGATTTADLDTLSLEWFTDTSGVGTAHMRGGLHARIVETGVLVYNDGDAVDSGQYDSTLDANFEADITFAATPDGVVYEAGGTGTGAFVGYNDSGDFIIRAGSGASVAPADAARIVITASDYDFSGRTGTLEWNFYPDTESLDLSFDEDSNGSIEFSTSTTAVSAFANWSGGDAGGVGTSNTNVAGSELTAGFDFNGTITQVRFSQTSGYAVEHWIHRSGNTVQVEYGVIELAGLETASANTFVDTLGSHTADTTVPAIATEMGGSFVITELTGSRNITSIVVTESGSIDAENALDNIEVYYDLDTSLPYDCSSESFTGTSTETQFGSTDTNGFSGADGVSSFTDSVAITTTQAFCGYVVYDVTDSAADGETIKLTINDPSTDVAVTGGGVVQPATVASTTGSTTVRNAELTQTHYHWLEDDGAEGSATSVEGGEDIAATGFVNGTVQRLRMQVSNEGSIVSDPVNLRLEYGAKVSTCSAVSSWTDVGAVGGDWDMSVSSFITDGADSSDLAVVNGGTTNENTTHLATNGALRDITSELGALTFATNNFLEAEFAIEPTATAPQGTSYCFRLSDAGTELRNYDNYAEATISADALVISLGTQVTTLNASSTDQYVGGSFAISRDGTSRNVTSITITETGSIDASTELSNVALYYETAADCSVESYGGGELQYGLTDTNGFSAANGSSTFTDTVAILTGTELCVYTVFDVASTTQNGETIDIEITNPAVDVAVDTSTVAPNSIVALTGSTTVLTYLLEQTHFHWRNDDGGETDATSATAGVEDVAITAVPKETTQRLRLQVSNEGAITSPATTYRLEYGTRVTTCTAVGSWIDVGAVGGAWDMSLSGNITDGDTTDIPLAADGAMTDENTTFVGTGALRETTSESGFITLTTAEFTELEYSIEATTDAGFGTTYCFRVTEAGDELDVYSVYAELTTRDQQDFFVQRGTETLSGTSLTLTAGVDYTAPSGTSSAFVRISNSHMTGAADNVGTNGQTANDVTAYISDQSDVTSSFTIERAASANSNTQVSWEIVEFIGLAGSDNEMIVRGVGEVAFSATEFTDNGAVTDPVSNDNDVVVFITGQQNDDTGAGNYNDGLFTASWDGGTSQPSFDRGDADSVANLGYAVVEFTGANWQIQRVEHTYSAVGVPEVESMDVIGSVSQAFIHSQKRVGEGLSSIDEGGHLVLLSSLGAVTFELRDSAQTPADHVSVAWVIANNQTGDGALRTYRSTGELNNPDPEPATYSVDIGATVNPENASIFGVNTTAGTGTTYPRLHTGFTIASSTHYEIYRSDTNNDMEYRVEVIEWPVAEISVRQNYYRFYVDNDAITPTDPWPVGAENLGENTTISASDDPLGEGERVRLRMSLLVNNATQPQGISAFKLQYGRQVTTCSAVSTWNDIGAPGSGAIWRGYDGTPADGTEVATSSPAAGTLLLSLSDVAGTYEEENSSAVNPYQVAVGEDVEYDWHIEHNGATQRTDYCFRMVGSDGTELDGYINYPAIRTTGYTPVIADWRWYDDEANITPTSDLASENVSPSNITNEEALKLRVVLSEVESAPGQNLKFSLQYSTQSDFGDGGTTLSATSSCTASSTWCYVDGGGVDNAVVPSAVLSSADSCVAGVGDGCGTHNEAPTTTSVLSQAALTNMEMEFTLQPVVTQVNTVYYFRLFDEGAGDPVVASSTYPSLVTEGARLTFTVSGVDAGQSIAGISTDATTTPTSISFGSMMSDNSYEAAQQLTVNTNATNGYQLLLYGTQDLLNVYGDAIPAITSTNAVPSAWSTACSVLALGCFGYHTTDATLVDGSTRFSPLDSYAALTTAPSEIMYSSLPTVDTEEIVYRLQYSPLQPAGNYETDIIYILVPVF